MHGCTLVVVSPAVEVDADTCPTLAVPGAVGIPGEQTVWLRLIAAAVGQGQLENLRTRADVYVLLQRNGGRRTETEGDEERAQPTPRDRNQREMKKTRRKINRRRESDSVRG